MSHPRTPVIPAAAPRRCGERGSATLQIAILFPVLLLLVLAIFQAGVFFYTQSAALSSAQEGVRATAAQGGTVGKGVQRATGFLQRVSGTLVESAQITGRRTATASSITVRGNVLTLIPMLQLTVSQTATLPSEEYS